jgi:hypothetical protein
MEFDAWLAREPRVTCPYSPWFTFSATTKEILRQNGYYECSLPQNLLSLLSSPGRTS